MQQWKGQIPDGLKWLEASRSGARWLAELPDLVMEVAAGWSLTVGSAFVDSHVSLVLAVNERSGEPAVLKVQYPDRESEEEPAALALWEGNGAVRLKAFDPKRRALLLERCAPGTPLHAVGAEEALEVLSGLLPRLWRPPGTQFLRLEDEAHRWAGGLEEKWERANRPFERALLESARDGLLLLSSTQGESVLLHQDLHGGNVLAAQREPWLVIDPKPLVGEREFGLAPVIRSAELGHRADLVVGRLDTLATRLDLDRERSRLWALAQTVAWAFEEDGVLSNHVEVARWLLTA